jgi:hypothetical protein
MIFALGAAPAISRHLSKGPAGPHNCASLRCAENARFCRNGPRRARRDEYRRAACPAGRPRDHAAESCGQPRCLRRPSPRGPSTRAATPPDKAGGCGNHIDLRVARQARPPLHTRPTCIMMHRSLAMRTPASAADRGIGPGSLRPSQPWLPRFRGAYGLRLRTGRHLLLGDVRARSILRRCSLFLCRLAGPDRSPGLACKGGRPSGRGLGCGGGLPGVSRSVLRAGRA